MYTLILKQYELNIKYKKNPFEKNFKKGKILYIKGIFMQEIEIGYSTDEGIPFFYMKLEEVKGKKLVEMEEKLKKVKTRNLKGIIKELHEKEIEIEKIIPLFDKDCDDLTKLLKNKNLKYVLGEEERLLKSYDFDNNDIWWYENDDEEIFNYLVEILRWNHSTCMYINEYYIIRDFYDLLKLENK
ncbi:MAG: hypothetical protein MJH09_06920 [Cetobacterium sp.]|nr:hypothetical protein [Cetobacterium sp.]